MVNEGDGGSELVDPLACYSGLYLFPRTFGVLPDNSKQYDSGSDLNAMHAQLKSMGLRSSSKFFEEAKAIVNRNSEILNSEITSYLILKEKNEESSPGIEDIPQERRPALNRKRARFSLKPNACQSAENLELTLDIKQLKDPEEFFLAYERLDNAKKEIENQMGVVSMELNQPNQSATVRHRRPGIIGRSVRYKHQYSSMLSEHGGNIASFQDMSKNISSSNLKTKQEHDLNDLLLENESDGAMIDNKVNGVLDELLSVNFKDLEGDGALNLLQERLRIKPIDLEKLCLPDFQDVHKKSFISSEGSFTKLKVGFSDIDSLLKGRTPVRPKEESESSVHHSASPTPLKSLFASFTSSKRRILESGSSKDPFLNHTIKPFPARNFSLFARTIRDSKSRLTEKNGIAINEAGSPEVSKDQFQIFPVENSKRCNVGTDDMTSGIHRDTQVNTQSNCGGIMNEQLNSPCVDMDSLASSIFEVEKKMEKHEGLRTEQLVVCDIDENAKHLSVTPSQIDETGTIVIENHVGDGVSNILDAGPEHQNEAPQVSLDKQGKTELLPRKQRKEKKYSRRQSLGGAGTKWESGVRRSTRIKSRPLEYWRGERLLYGRIHESLVTVIGLKYASPAKGNRRCALKVKSYVSDEYKELVELAALH